MSDTESFYDFLGSWNSSYYYDPRLGTLNVLEPAIPANQLLLLCSHSTLSTTLLYEITGGRPNRVAV